MIYRILILITVFIFSCKTKDESNSIILPKDKMVKIIVDIELSQAAYKVKKEDHKFNLTIIETSIFKQHQTTKLKFEESLKHYSLYPSQMEEIYNNVIANISSKQAGKQAN